MPEAKGKVVNCPNCQGPAIWSGNEITCAQCDAIFTITKKNGAKVKKLGPIQDLDERVKKIEAKIFIEEPEVQQVDEDDEPEPDQEIVDGDILPR